MQLSGIESLFGTQGLTEIEKIRRSRQESSTADESDVLVKDRVTISEEGRRLAEEMQARKKQAEGSTLNAVTKNGESAESSSLLASSLPEGESRAAAAEGKPSGGSGGGGNGSSSSSESIEAQIQSLQAKIQTIASSNLPESIKESTMATYQAQIAELQSQLQQAQA